MCGVHYHTIVMAAVSGDDLFSSGDISRWQAALLCYEQVVELKAAGKTKKAAKSASKDKETLIELDSWYQNTLPDLIASRDEPHLTHEELAKLMKWKLTRGKFRPRLGEMVKENSREEVKGVTKKGLAVLPDLNAAMTHLTKLKAVGPATASAIMCASAPEVAPFMADEAVLSVPDLGKLDYTQKHYLAYASKIQDKAKQLTTLDSYRRWSGHDVELALWSFHFAKKLQPELLDDESSSCSDSEPIEHRPGKKRTNSNKGDENSTDSDSEGDQGSSSQATKKRKQ